METVSVSDARRRLSDLVRAAENGQSVTITRRGREVARIVPAEQKPSERLPDLSDFRASIQVKGKPLSEVVQDIRAEERY